MSEILVPSDVIQSTWVCSTHRIPIKFLENSLNARIGQLGSSDNEQLRAALIRAFTLTDPVCEHCEGVSYLGSTNNDVDFLVTCPTDRHIRGGAEHKPLGANPTGSEAVPEMYLPTSYSSSRLVESPVLDAPSWIANLDPACKVPHRVIDCNSWHLHIPSRRRGFEGYLEFAAPQLLVYAHRHRFELDRISIISDQGFTASEIYETDRWGQNSFQLSTEVFPLITTRQVLTGLAVELEGVEVSLPQRIQLVSIFEAMAHRAGLLSQLDLPAWIRDEAHQCSGTGPGCDVIIWKDLPL
ncbi:hypothetical protein BH686_16740 [Rhodococcus erythropolis]|nr:hypothetical protein BH686_16740 [Rhodococcus erythropolis]